MVNPKNHLDGFVVCEFINYVEVGEHYGMLIIVCVFFGLVNYSGYTAH